MADPSDDFEPIEGAPAGGDDFEPIAADAAPEPKKGAGLINNFLYGVNERLGGLARAGEDIAAGNISVAGYPIPVPWKKEGETPRPVSGFLKEHFYPTDAVTGGERIARTAGSYVPDTLAMAALGPTAIGARGAEAAADVTSPLVRQVAGRVAAGPRAPLATSPVATLAGETGAGAGAGAGGEAYRQRPGDHSVPAEMLAEFAGAGAAGLVPAAVSAPARVVKGWLNYSPTGKLVSKGAEVAAEHLPPDMLERFPGLKAASERRATARRDQAMKDLQAEFGALGEPEAQKAIAEAERLRGEIGPSFTPTLGEATGMQSALTTQRAIESRASGADLDALATGYRGRRKAVEDFLSGAGPAAPGNEAERAMAPATAAGRMVSRERSAVEEALAKVDQDEASALSSYLPEADRYKAGEALMDRLMTAKGETSARMSKMFDELVPAENQFVPFGQLKQRIAALKPSMFADTSDLGPTVKKIMDWEPGIERPTFSDVRYLRESLGDEQRAAFRAGNRQLSRRIGQAIGEVDDFLENDWAKGLNKDVADKYRQFRQTYKADYIDRFERGATRDAKKIGADNEFKTPNEDVAFEFWTPGGVTEAKQFKATFGDDPLAKKALYAVALDDLRKRAVRDGRWNLNGYKAWLRANEANLKEFPDLREHVGTMQGAIDALSARRAELIGRQSEIAEHVLTKTLKRDPDKIAEIALSNPASARTLAAEMTPAEREMTGRLAWDRAIQKGASADDMRKLLADRRGALSVWLKPDQLKALDDAAKAWAMLERTSPPTGTATEADLYGRVGKSIGTGLPQLASRMFAVKSGRTSMDYTMVDLMVRAGIAANKREADTLARQAIYDPAFAKDLARYVGAITGKGVKPQMPRPLKAYVGAVLARPRGMTEEAAPPAQSDEPVPQ